MNVLIATNALRPPVTGIGVYVQGLVAGLLDNPRVETLHGLQDGRVHALTALPPIADDAAAVAVPSVIRRASRKARRVWHRVAGARALRKLGPTVYHEPNYLPVRYRGPKVITVHDLSHHHYPDFHPAARVMALNRALPQAVADAAGVITVSEYVAEEVRTHFDVDPARVHAIHNGVSPAFAPRAPDTLAVALRRYGLTPGAYVLSVATLEPRKNLERLMRAYAALPQALQDRFPLALAGATGWRNGGIHRLLDRLIVRGRAIRLGYVPACDLPFIYAGSGAFAYPAIYEGFGLPPLEAMASGVPTLTSSTSAMPEVAGDAALQVDPYSVDAIRNGLERLLDDELLRHCMRSAGPRRAAEFSWRRAAERTLDVYQQALQ